MAKDDSFATTLLIDNSCTHELDNLQVHETILSLISQYIRHKWIMCSDCSELYINKCNNIYKLCVLYIIRVENRTPI